MKRNGSITIFLTLTLLLILSLLGASFNAIRISAARVRGANGAEEALFSLFSEYDRDLLDAYDLFLLDAGMDAGTLRLDTYAAFLTEAREAVLHPASLGFLSISPVAIQADSVSFTAYTSAAELDGAVLAAQAVEAMRDTIGLTTLNELRALISGDRCADTSAGTGNGSIEESVLEIKEAASEHEDDTPAPEVAEEPQPTILDTIVKLQKMGILELVRPAGMTVSDYAVTASMLASHRKAEPSLGIVQCKTDLTDLTSRLLFDEYLMQHFGNARDPGRGFSYEIEYLLCGKLSDLDNLKGTVRKLLLTRTAINAAFLAADPTRSSEASAAAAAIAAALTHPELEPLIKPVLIAGWGWCESVLDVRALLSGKRVPAVKSEATWQLSVESIPLLLTDADTLLKDTPAGLSYEDYLRILLIASPLKDLETRMPDTIEQGIRRGFDRPSFRIDLCLDTIEADFAYTAQNHFSFHATRRYSYRKV